MWRHRGRSSTGSQRTSTRLILSLLLTWHGSSTVWHGWSLWFTSVPSSHHGFSSQCLSWWLCASTSRATSFVLIDSWPCCHPPLRALSWLIPLSLCRVMPPSEHSSNKRISIKLITETLTRMLSVTSGWKVWMCGLQSDWSLYPQLSWQGQSHSVSFTGRVLIHYW